MLYVALAIEQRAPNFVELNYSDTVWGARKTIVVTKREKYDVIHHTNEGNIFTNPKTCSSFAAPIIIGSIENFILNNDMRKVVNHYAKVFSPEKFFAIDWSNSMSRRRMIPEFVPVTLNCLRVNQSEKRCEGVRVMQDRNNDAVMQRMF